VDYLDYWRTQYYIHLNMDVSNPDATEVGQDDGITLDGTINVVSVSLLYGHVWRGVAYADR